MSEAMDSGNICREESVMENPNIQIEAQPFTRRVFHKETVTHHSMPLSESSRFSCVDAAIIKHENGTVRIAMTLPLRIRRAEANGIMKELARINEQLEDNEAFMLEPASGRIVLENISISSDADGSFDSAFNAAIATIDKYSDDILEEVVTEAIDADCRKQEEMRKSQHDEKASFGERLCQYFKQFIDEA